MRIISKFRDYYDCMQRPGVTEPLYIRNELLVKYDDKDVWDWPRLNRWDMAGYCQVIGFAGIVMVTCVKEYYDKSQTLRRRRLFTLEELIADYESRASAKDIRYWKRRAWGPYREARRLYEHPVPQHMVDDAFKRAPIWIACQDTRSVHYNCKIKGILEKHFPPPQAYQQLQYWFGNLANPEPPIPKIDDVTMAEAKGFDEFSFRKPPTKKRRK